MKLYLTGIVVLFTALHASLHGRGGTLQLRPTESYQGGNPTAFHILYNAYLNRATTPPSSNGPVLGTNDYGAIEVVTVGLYNAYLNGTAIAPSGEALSLNISEFNLSTEAARAVQSNLQSILSIGNLTNTVTVNPATASFVLQNAPLTSSGGTVFTNAAVIKTGTGTSGGNLNVGTSNNYYGGSTVVIGVAPASSSSLRIGTAAATSSAALVSFNGANTWSGSVNVVDGTLNAATLGEVIIPNVPDGALIEASATRRIIPTGLTINGNIVGSAGIGLSGGILQLNNTNTASQTQEGAQYQLLNGSLGSINTGLVTSTGVPNGLVIDASATRRIIPTGLTIDGNTIANAEIVPLGGAGTGILRIHNPASQTYEAAQYQLLNGSTVLGASGDVDSSLSTVPEPGSALLLAAGAAALLARRRRPAR